MPWLWPTLALAHPDKDNLFYRFGKEMIESEIRVSFDVLQFMEEAHKLDYELKPIWATLHTIKHESKTMILRDFSDAAGKGFPVLIDAPYAGHSATIADYSPHQSLVSILKANGLQRLYVTDWKSATDAMKDFTIDTYLEDLDAAVDVLGGKVHLIGLCQGGWMSAAYAARFPEKVQSLVLAGSPIDADAGEGAVKDMAHTLPMSFYRELVEAGGGRLLGKLMLASWKNMHPTDQYIKKYVDLFTHIEDESYVAKAEEFARWYEAPLDLPGAYYLQAVEWIFKENRLVRGTFVALGKTISLKDILIPVYMLAGDADDITPAAQVFGAENYLGTEKGKMIKELVPGGHIGLFMGHHTLQVTWPKISQWILNL